MIPKSIVFTWINAGTPDTPVMRRCFESWAAVLPDYRVSRIHLHNVRRESRYVREALAAGRWVNASNFARLEHLYRQGGIYLDVDIEVIRSFDDLLDNTCFIGIESPKRVNQAVLGAEPGHWFLKECMERIEDGYDGGAPPERAVETGPLIVTRVLRDHGWREGDVTTRIRNIQVLDSSYFYPYHFSKQFRAECIKPQTHCVHHWACGWLPWRKKVEAAVLGHGPIGALRRAVAVARGRTG